MEPDLRLFGQGPYPSNGRYVVLARMAFVAALAAILVAVFLPSRYVPDFVHSLYLQHFAAYYVAGLLALAASPRTAIRIVALRVAAFATVVESLHLISGARLGPLIDNWVADMGGLAAAMAPVAVAGFRRRFGPPKANP
jgi:hypothetical protein